MVVDSICPFCCAQPRRDSWLLGLLLDQQLNSFGKEVQPAQDLASQRGIDSEAGALPDRRRLRLGLAAVELHAMHRRAVVDDLGLGRLEVGCLRWRGLQGARGLLAPVLAVLLAPGNSCCCHWGEAPGACPWA